MKINEMELRKDGNEYFVSLKGFVNLQESEVIWLDDYEKNIVRDWFCISFQPLIHLPLINLIHIFEQLSESGNQPQGKDGNDG